MTSKRSLTEEQMAQIVALLNERRRAIEEELRRNLSRALEEGGEETTVVNVEEGDESRVDVGKETDYQVMSMRSQELKQIKEALLRIESGEYGLCEECGSAIRFERLKAMPFAQLCRSCQEEMERAKRDKQWGPRAPHRG
ncbi:MAG: TraR/DksA family transcriptional regulator [bacterium]